MRVARLGLFAGAILLATTALAEEDMDHGLDFDFSDSADGDLIPVTPKEGGEEDDHEHSSAPAIPDYEEDEEEGWKIYLQYLKQYTKQYEEVIVNQIHYAFTSVTRHFLYAEHKSPKNSKQAFIFGLSEGLYKLQPRGQANCITDGATFTKAFVQLMRMFIKKRFIVNSQEQFAFDDVTVNMMHKCMMQDTLPATMLLNGAMFAIDMSPEIVSSKLQRIRFQMRVIDLIGGINNLIELAYFINVLLYKSDPFTLGRTLGKLVKLVVQFKLVLYTGNANYLYVPTEDDVEAVIEVDEVQEIVDV